MHSYGDMTPQRFCRHDLDLLETRDVFGHVTIRLAVVHFLWMVHCDHASIWHRYGDMAPQTLDARTDAQVIFILCPKLCIALDSIVIISAEF